MLGWGFFPICFGTHLLAGFACGPTSFNPCFDSILQWLWAPPPFYLYKCTPVNSVSPRLHTLLCGEKRSFGCSLEHKVPQTSKPAIMFTVLYERVSLLDLQRCAQVHMSKHSCLTEMVVKPVHLKPPPPTPTHLSLSLSLGLERRLKVAGKGLFIAEGTDAIAIKPDTAI